MKFQLRNKRHLQPGYAQRPGFDNRFGRRAFLGGAGVAVALPFFESLAPRSRWIRSAKAEPGDDPLRLVAFYVPNGIDMDDFVPATTGPDYAATAILQPLFDLMLEQNVLVLSGLDNVPAKPDGAGDHAAGTAAFLTCRSANKSETDIVNGISMDQVYANALGDTTSIASLQLGIDGGASIGNCDSGYSCAYSRNISWADSANPLPKLTSPQVAFDLLFGGYDPQATAEENARRRAYRLSVLDYVEEDATALQSKLGATDRQKLEQYLDGIRDLELRIETEAGVCDTSAYSYAYQDVTGHVRAMLDLMVLSMSCDLTRVVSFMLSNGGSGRNYDFIGVPASHHDISHHGSDPVKLDQLRIIDTWEVAQLAYLLDRMRGVSEGESNLLENSLVYFSSEIEDGNSHSHYNMPIILAGSAGGQFINGQHLSFDEGKVSELFITMLQSLGVDISSFGDDGIAPLAGLTV
ncbi:DUF1552 domain-containing protein [Pseudenhygromyxa sp. WMMC2535]|uniref:DUF1552 domain-containing protein n=1 Tax=Pseudenhygromyxa sp. WMMC2535 TaxID=2712867 RepID=UPI001551BF29|nr:DUF1552 domain-containing protein [Pseudenhygromyxa sp. WMMC2535]NVB42581.1 DUF1552 domain-containing protein [Pseudenhygromyxa sp. WMMC2535]